MCTGLDHVHTHTVADDRTGSCTDTIAVSRTGSCTDTAAVDSTGSCTDTAAADRTGSCTDNMAVDRIFLLVSWCFEPSQPQRITSGLRVDTGLDHIQTIQLWMGLDYIETI